MLDFEGLPPLVDVTDLSTPSGDVEQADLDAVCNDIRYACGWHIAPVVAGYEMVINAEGGTILTVPSLKMAEPAAVLDANGGEITGWSWSSNGILEAHCWPSGLRSVTVIADSGFEKCPPALIAVIDDILADRAGVKSAEYSQISLDGASLTRENVYGSGPRGAQRDLMSTYGHVLGRFAIR
ncbi:hypothetical protein E7939_21985 [Salmonella enterica]|nr:hypothetical protein [Salmonella enterica]